MQARLKDGSVIIAGWVGSDAEYKQIGDKNTPLTTFSVRAGERPIPEGSPEGTKPEAIWVNCKVWFQLASRVKGLKKYDPVMCVGKVKTESYNDKEGNPKTATWLECEFVVGAGIVAAAKAASDFEKQEVPVQDDFAIIDNDEDLPF